MRNTVHADVQDTQATGYRVVMSDRAGWDGFGWEGCSQYVYMTSGGKS